MFNFQSISSWQIGHISERFQMKWFQRRRRNEPWVLIQIKSIQNDCWWLTIEIVHCIYRRQDFKYLEYLPSIRNRGKKLFSPQKETPPFDPRSSILIEKLLIFLCLNKFYLRRQTKWMKIISLFTKNTFTIFDWKRMFSWWNKTSFSFEEKAFHLSFIVMERVHLIFLDICSPLLLLSFIVKFFFFGRFSMFIWTVFGQKSSTFLSNININPCQKLFSFIFLFFSS